MKAFKKSNFHYIAIVFLIVAGVIISPSIDPLFSDSSELPTLLTDAESNQRLVNLNPGSLATVSLPLQNRFSSDVTIFRIETSCRCTRPAISLPLQLSPGETANLRIEWEINEAGASDSAAVLIHFLIFGRQSVHLVRLSGS